MRTGPLLVLALAAGAVRAAPPPPARPPADDTTSANDDADAESLEADAPGQEGDDDLPPAPDAAGSIGDGAALLAEARRELGALRRSTYTHRTSVDEAAGHFDYDCSGFVDYALRVAAPRALATLAAATVRRPLARHFVAFLAAGGGGPWRPVARAAELAPGDLVAWTRPADVVTRNTGHVMLVRGAVAPGPDGTLAVPIIDSTSVRHGRGDSRTPARASGLGTGEILLVVDQRGAPVGYRWSRGRRARVHRTTVALGRLVAAPTRP
jgi:hypothetical protein